MRRRFFLTAAAAVTGFLMTTGAAQADVAQDLSSESVIESIKQRGALKIGLSTFTPWAIRDKKGRPTSQKLADELVAAYNREGTAMTRRENVHRMADANKAFAHFAW